MSLDTPNWSPSAPEEIERTRICLLAARFNDRLVGGLLEQTIRSLEEFGVRREHIVVRRVPGSAELALASLWQASSGNFDAVIALGVLIAGETQHHDIIARTVSIGLQDVSLRSGVPVINGVICAETLKQAEDRTLGPIARGKEFAQAALEMAHWKTTT